MNGKGRLQWLRASDGAPLALHFWPSHSQSVGQVLLLHGFSQNVRTFVGPHQSLPAFLNWYGFDVVAAELRGAGLSRKAGAPLPTGFGEYLGKDLPAIWDAVLTRPTVVVGHSMGGIWSLYTALKRSQDVLGAVAWASPARLGFPKTLAWAEGAMSRLEPATRVGTLARQPFPFHLLGHAAATMIRAGLAGLMDHRDLPFAWGSLTPLEMEEHYRQGFDPVSLGQVQELIQWRRTGILSARPVARDLRAELAGVTTPVMLLNSAADTVVPPAHVFNSMDLPNAPVTAMDWDGMGHLDIVLSPRAESELWPDLVRWIQARFQARSDSSIAVRR